MKHVAAVATATVLATTAILASPAPPVSIPERVRGADQVVVATVSDLSATFESNSFGDRLIVSHAKLRVEERLKGETGQTLDLDILGGTIGNLTLDVSSLPRVKTGDRGVFFLDNARQTGRLVPHLDGQGILKLDPQDRVKGTSLDLNSIRAMAASVNGR